MAFFERTRSGVDPAPRPAVTVAAGLLRSMRPRQWIKNLIVAAGPMGTGVLLDEGALWPVAVSIGAFCAASSAVYLSNDVADLAADRGHPRKRLRPIAAGVVPLGIAVPAAVILGLSAVAAGVAVSWAVAGIVVLYLALFCGYSAGLKHRAVIDLLIVATGFALRVAAGAAATETPISPWFITATALGALAVAAGKRSSELARPDQMSVTRKVLDAYSPGYLAQVQTIAVSSALVAYAVWAFQRAEGVAVPVAVQLSVAPVAVALLRYLLVVSRAEAETPEEAMFADPVLSGAGLLWVGLLVVGVGR